MNVFRVVEALEALDGDGEAERHEEDRVHQRAQHLGPRPTEGVLNGDILGKNNFMASTINLRDIWFHTSSHVFLIITIPLDYIPNDNSFRVQ